MAQSKIKSIEFSNEWNPPSGSKKFVFNVEMYNGDKGKFYSETQTPTISVETEISYVVAGNTLKDIRVVVQTPAANSSTNTGSGIKNAEQIASYACQHAKDIVVAKIIAKEKGVDPEKEIVKLSTAIYKHMVELPGLPLWD